LRAVDGAERRGVKLEEIVTYIYWVRTVDMQAASTQPSGHKN
jgi:hypothetical protein